MKYLVILIIALVSGCSATYEDIYDKRIADNAAMFERLAEKQDAMYKLNKQKRLAAAMAAVKAAHRANAVAAEKVKKARALVVFEIENQCRGRWLELAMRGSYAIGMTVDCLNQFIRPKRKNRSVYSFGTREQWVLGGGNYIYIKNGIITSWSVQK